ncbi:MAG: ribosome biogenesis GTPase Der [Betaproteobacteria bacterium TMED156]|nr:MAG: ribosome biogenesis GTPase Der [Betaproteobacteria bacterium TMED156]
MLPIVVIVGRSNVGKSTLFNRLTRSRDALVGNVPGLTRDRNFGEGVLGNNKYFIVDTGGFEPKSKDSLQNKMSLQTEEAINESDEVIFLVDGKHGLSSKDQIIAGILRRTERPIHLVVNKLEGKTTEVNYSEFFELGLGMPIAISAEHGDGVKKMIENIIPPHTQKEDMYLSQSESNACDETKIRNYENVEPFNNINSILNDEKKFSKSLRISIVGRPNVGKSTLFNSLVGEDRAIAYDMPGTTRDSISVPFVWSGKDFLLVDTAGIRKRGKIADVIEKFSVIKAMQAIRASNVAILLLDCSQEISDQDAHLASFIANSGCALVLGVNKWDEVYKYDKDETKRMIERKLGFLSWSKCHYISAKNGDGIISIMKSVVKAYEAATKSLNTPKLTKILKDCVQKHPPPKKGLFRPKLRYAHQGGKNPPVIVLHGNNLHNLSSDYLRFLENNFRESFDLFGTPLKLEWKNSDNPYKKK